MGLAARGAGGVAVVSFGDGATNQGGAHEALVFALARNLPVLFVCENNAWSEMTPIKDTVPRAELWARAAGYGMPASRIDGSDVALVSSSAAEAIARIRAGGGPEFVEIAVPRILGHYNGDIQQYRTNEDKDEHKDRDPIDTLILKLLADGTLTSAEMEAIRAEVEVTVQTAKSSALAAALPDIATARDHVVSLTAGMARGALPTEGKELAYGLAVNRALTTELEKRDNMILFGEDIAIPGGSFGVTRNLRKNFGDRVFDTPISETAILGAAIGSSLEGLRPVVEIMWTDFLLVAFDQIVNQASNVRYISRGAASAPLVIRMQQGITPGSCAQHSQSLEALIAHIPGIKVGLPSNPEDAYAMTRAAIADNDPVVIIESRALYLDKALVDLNAAVEAVGGARTRRSGEDVLLVTWGRMTKIVLEAAAELEGAGISSRVLDLRWLAPLDEESIADAVENTKGRVAVIHEANLTGGFGAEIAARISERHFDRLAGPVLRIGLPDVRVPSAPILQEALMPSTDQIIQSVRRLMAFPQQ